MKNVVKSATEKLPRTAKPKAEIKAVELKGKKLEAIETEILTRVAGMKSKSVQYILQDALSDAKNWKLLDITYSGKKFTDNEGKERISQNDGIVFQHQGEKQFVRKIVIR